MGRADLIGNGKHHLIPTFQPLTDGGYQSARRKNSTPTGAKAATAAPVKQVKPMKPGQPQKGRILTQIPAGRMGSAQEIAAAVLYLASAEAGYVTGATLHVNGGMAMV